MSLYLTRMFTYFTLGLYLVAGVVAVRVFTPEMTVISLDTSYAELFSKYEVKNAEELPIVAPEIAFTKIIHPKAPSKVIPVQRVATKKAVVNKVAEMKIEKVQYNELPFQEPVQLHPVHIQVDLERVAGLYKEFRYEETVVAENATDEVSTKLAADAEPEFFEYDEKIEAPKEITKEDVKEETVVAETEVPQAPMAEAAPVQEPVLNQTEEVELNDLIAFDYSKAKEDLKSQNIPAVSTVTTHHAGEHKSSKGMTLKWDTSKAKKSPGTVTTQSPAAPDNQKGFLPEETYKSAYSAPAKTYDAFVTIKASGTNLKKTVDEVGFEVRFQDAINESLQDYNNGDVTVREVLSTQKMTRSMVMLKRGYAPTNTDLIIEEGSAEITIPLIEENTFNELMAPFGARGSIGAVLVELDQKTETASLDVPYSQVLKLDEDLKVTTGEFTYQLFVGVKAGNALLSYKTNGGKVYSKIVHIHEHELTFDSDILEAVDNNTFSLVENDLLGKETTPLILSTEEVRQFATEKTATKISDHTYKINFENILLGTRKYVELSHQSEPVFIGFRNNNMVEVPSESFMRYVLSRFEGSKLGNRCLVQVNLTKKASQVEVGSESTASSLMTSFQALDTDGKFYDSVGEKTKKVIVVGESHGAPELGQDGKINLKISYQDGSVQYIGSYCSPNTYLVEQL